MHYRFLVTCDTQHAKNSLCARVYVFATLQAESLYTEGRFSSAFADWFVVGGRWSGELSRHSWATLLAAHMHALEEQHGVEVWGAYYRDEGLQRLQRDLAERFQDMWNAAAPHAYRGIPIQRDTYKAHGYEDDAMLLSQELYDHLLKECAGHSESEYHVDLDGDDVSPEMVGHKWVVVVDYHA